MAVRFGNVLGSRGSVVPTFQQQIAAGGPVTVTHPEMKRFFMTIPEAVQLVLQAAVLGARRRDLRLGYGRAGAIVDMARDLIRLSGYELGRDIEIKYTGLRPGEKLFEELFVEGEVYGRTAHEKIFAAFNAATQIPSYLDACVDALTFAAQRDDRDAIVTSLKAMVPEYSPPTPAPPPGAAPQASNSPISLKSAPATIS